MTKLSKKNQKRLAKLISMALMCAGGLCSLPSAASATEATVKNVTGSSGSYNFDCDPDGSVGWIKPDSTDYCVPTAADVDVLNIKGTFNTGDLGFLGGYSSVAGVSGKTINVKDNGTNITVLMIYGGLDASGSSVSVEGNTVNVASGTIFTTIIGGGRGGIASGNHVNITGGTINYGGYGCTIVGGGSAYGGAENNTVTISGGKISSIGTTPPLSTTSPLGISLPAVVFPAVIEGGSTSADGKNAKGNVVTIGGDASITGTNLDVYGGRSNGKGGNATDNTVAITGGTITGSVYVYGGNSDVSEYYGIGLAGDANKNTVTISGGTIGEASAWSNIVGGYTSGNGKSASDNTVTISGDVQLLGDVRIYGGQSKGTDGIANNNTVNILTKIVAAEFMGGDGTTSSGNTLNIAAKGVTTGAVYGFQNMNFYLPSDIANNDTMLTVNGSSATDVKGVTFGVAALQGVSLQKGDTVNLITNPSGLTMDDTLKTTDSATLAKAEFLSANSLTTDDAYELSISKKDANTIIATVDNVTEKKAPEEAVGDILKSPVETRAGVVTMINAGADLLVSQGMANAADAAAAERTEGDAAAAPRAGGFAPFAAVSFGKLRAESGSHVDNKGIGMNLGFAKEIENKSGKLLVGPVIEYGHGSYDSYQDNGITADGKSSYWGIGVIAKQTNHNGFYYEGSIRAGRTKSDYGSDNVKPGTHVSYDSSATYWAAHLGVGKLADIGHDNTLDYYGKYFYSHTGSDSTYLNGANETANFDAVNSHRIRLGARLTHALNEKNKLYGGLAWQYEFKGDARATYSVSGEAPSPSVKGSSGMIELGWQVKPGKSPMTIDLGVTGWVGKQRGITANVQANWTF